jgi:3-hydroxyisobutyrate dehydrogenase
MQTGMPANPELKAGFLGLGAMGAPMAHHLQVAGFLRAVYNRSPERAKQFQQDHPDILIAESPQALASLVDVVFLCVSADADVLEQIKALSPSLRSEHIVIDCSTVSRMTAIEASHLVTALGAQFFDAPVTGGVEGARNGALSVMLGGEQIGLSKILPLLATFSSRQTHMGEVGSGQAAKAVNQVMCAGINEAVTEALAFGVGLGLDIEKVMDAIRGGAAGNWFLDKRGSSMTQGCFNPGFKVELHQKDLRICLEMAEAIHQDLALTRTTSNHYAMLIDEGHGNEDISSLYRIKRPST